MSNLFGDKISGKSGTSSGAPITLSGDTATLGSGVTIPAAGITGTLGSGVAFPAGHIIQNKILHVETGASSLGTSSGNWDSMVGGNFTTKTASTGSFLRFWVTTSRIHMQSGVTGQITMTLRQSSSSTTQADGDDMFSSITYKPQHWLESNVGSDQAWTQPYDSGTDSDSTANVSNISSWSAGETLYWRLFAKKTSGGANIFVYYANSRMTIWVEEIAI